MTAIMRERMGRDGITKTALAAAVGISRPQVQKILTDQKRIDIEQMDEIFWALGLDARAEFLKAEAQTSDRHAEPSWKITPL